MNVATEKELTYGQKKAGLTVDSLKRKAVDVVIQMRVIYSHVFDLLKWDMENDPDEEKRRLAEIAIDETQNNMRTTIRALTFGKH